MSERRTTRRYRTGQLRQLRPAVCVIIRHPARAGHHLMIQRAAHDVGGGFWTPVTGSCERGESQMDAVVREVLEEVGLAVTPLRKLWECPNSFRSHVLHWWTAAPTAEAIDAGLQVVPQESEIDDWRWVTLEEALALAPMFDDTRYFFEVFGGKLWTE